MVKQELTWYFRDNLENEEQMDHLEIRDSGWVQIPLILPKHIYLRNDRIPREFILIFHINLFNAILKNKILKTIFGK